MTIADEAVPLASLPEDPVTDGLVPIMDEDVPLAALPKTGQRSGNEMALFVSAFLLGAAGLFRKKNQEEES